MEGHMQTTGSDRANGLLDRKHHSVGDNTSKLVHQFKFIRDRRWSLHQKHQLLSALKSPDKIYASSDAHLQSVLGSKFQRPHHGVDQKHLKKDLDWIKETQNAVIFYDDECYPTLLKQIADPPIALFCRGNLALLKEPKIAIVGSRRPTKVGEISTTTIACGLAELGIVITSGMALGIDAVAHRSVLKNREPTIAVMGAGLDIIAPARHRSLFHEIASHGLLISEYPLGVPASKYTFPKRNRIVSGLSFGVVIVEAAKKSGTLITARLANEQNREVFVVPGSPLNPQYQGSHDLIRQGAILVENAENVVQGLTQPLQAELNSRQAQSEVLPCDNLKTQPVNALINSIGYERTSLDKIISNSGLTAAKVSSILLELELKGHIAMVDGEYLRIR